MIVGWRQLSLSVFAITLATVILVFFTQNLVLLGNQSLLLRAVIVAAAILAALIAVYPFNPLFTNRLGVYALVVCLPATLPSFFYFLYMLPIQAGGGITAEQIQSQLITDSSSNGIIEVGFAYPIYTPTITVTNNELYTRSADVYLRMTDGNNEDALFRAVRREITGTSLSVESTVRNMLSRNDEYEFSPLELAPGRSVTGRVVFIISDLNDGSTFDEALGRSYPAQFELRDPASSEILTVFPLDKI
ncbi:MAG: hypothetical protein QGG67_01230 [Gammaproteobacteria bacterium]|jgi:hypothetical protein|nr:hypothetical protein [Gammaproteobacteria bacterium]MDP6094609.1 hypothetical protein [Gammaproteobacteria bacterium]|tara:strand:- start:493 stop:1233 length:741 start_codon:yes stop_codon:yes gene_type:complete